jgi:hypothetical protein
MTRSRPAGHAGRLPMARNKASRQLAIAGVTLSAGWVGLSVLLRTRRR